MLLPIFLIVLVDVFALTLVLPLLAIYAERFGASPLEATLLISIFAVCQLVSGPILGRTSDRIGRKPMLLVSQAGTLVGLLVMANATSLAMIFVGRVIDGIDKLSSLPRGTEALGFALLVHLAERSLGHQHLATHFEIQWQLYFF